MTRTNAENAAILRKAADVLGTPARWVLGSAAPDVTFTYLSAPPMTYTSNAPAPFSFAIVCKMFRETADEFDEPNTGIVCGHCWDNVALACSVLGLESENFDEQG